MSSGHPHPCPSSWGPDRLLGSCPHSGVPVKWDDMRLMQEFQQAVWKPKDHIPSS